MKKDRGRLAMAEDTAGMGLRLQLERRFGRRMGDIGGTLSIAETFLPSRGEEIGGGERKGLVQARWPVWPKILLAEGMGLRLQLERRFGRCMGDIGGTLASLYGEAPWDEKLGHNLPSLVRERQSCFCPLRHQVICHLDSARFYLRGSTSDY